jgi:hypothetical protein
MYFIGLFIVSMAIGFRWEQIDGWLVLGGGLIFASIFKGLWK